MPKESEQVDLIDQTRTFKYDCGQEVSARFLMKLNERQIIRLKGDHPVSESCGVLWCFWIFSVEIMEVMLKTYVITGKTKGENNSKARPPLKIEKMS